MTRPGDAGRVELLAQAMEQLAEVRWGLRGYLARVAEMADGGFPPAGAGGGGSGHGDPTGDRLGDDGRRRSDPARKEIRDFDREVRAVWHAVRRMHGRYSQGCEPQWSARRMADPGCELCAQVPDHHCPTYATSDVGTTARRGVVRRRMRLCYWCWRFARPNRNDRPPTRDEVQAHADGRRVLVRQ